MGHGAAGSQHAVEGHEQTRVLTGEARRVKGLETGGMMKRQCQLGLEESWPRGASSQAAERKQMVIGNTE